jgi:ppGpp synthetase/RelA/SpoT-type nucleotidyltranferase
MQSLEQKILVKQKYASLSEITDIVGIRVITYFEDEVDIIANINKSLRARGIMMNELDFTIEMNAEGVNDNVE